MANLEHIARLSGVSKATVSRVINGFPHVSAETRLRVQQIIDEMDYVPNRTAVSLSKGRTQQIGLVTGTISEVIMPFLNGFIETAKKHDYQTVIYFTGDDPATELQAFEDLRSKRTDALVIVTCANPPSLLSTYSKYGPIVSWQRMPEHVIPSVAMDQGIGYSLALKHLLATGRRRIAHAFGRPESLNTQSRMRSYENIMHEHGLPIARELYFSSIYSVRHGEQLIQTLLERQKEGHELPDAILCSNDYVAAGILCEARRHSLSVPGDLAIVGFDDNEISRTLELTTVHNPIRAQAEHAFYMLAPTLLHTELKQSQLEYKLIQRSTT